VKLVMTLLARDEADIVDAHLAFHLNAGVDFVVATDHRSTDGTTEILEAYEREGCLHLIRERGDRLEQAAWVTRMARLAATQFGADWVVNSDADEFWWPRGGDLKQALASVPERYGVVRAVWRNFLPRPEDDRFFAERMTVRLRAPAPINDPTSQYRPSFKIAHRADPHVTVEQGNHGLLDSRFRSLRGWYPLELLHFPLRSRRQYEQRYRAIWNALGDDHRADHIRVERAREEGRLAATYERLVVRDGELEQGLGEGRLVQDLRVREALLALRRPAGSEPRRFLLPAEGPRRLVFPRPTAAEEAAHAADAAAAHDADLVRLQRHIDQLEARLAGR
jgi:hypothetical protein